jgi:hypothetical protein
MLAEPVARRPIHGLMGDQPGKVTKVRDYSLKPGDVHLYNEGVVHSPRREGDTRLIRVEGVSMAGVKRDKYEVAA